MDYIGRLFWSKSRRQEQDELSAIILPFPATQSQRPSPSHRTISPPIPRSTATSLTGFDNPYLGLTPPGTPNAPWTHPNQNPSLTRLAAASQSNIDVHGLNRSKPSLLPPEDLRGVPVHVEAPLPVTIRIETDNVSPQGPAPPPLRRTVSSPPMSPYHPSPTSSASSAEITPTAFAVPSIASHGGKWNLKLQTGPGASTQSLPTTSAVVSPPMVLEAADQRPHTDVYGYAYNYPLAKQLSPIAEQDYLSPDSLKRTQSLPASAGSASRTASDKDLRFSASGASASPGGSQGSEPTRPSPSYSSPFITRQLNRTASQTSSRTHVSATSSTAVQSRHSSKAIEVPIIPPLDLRPPFPGPHPSSSGSGGPYSRPPRSHIGSMPMILGSTEGGESIEEEDGYEYATTNESLHADSFVTAASNDHPGRSRGALAGSVREIEVMEQDESRTVPVGGPSDGRSTLGSQKLPSASESFITRRWDRDANLGNGVRTFRAKKEFVNATPAFWTFWLGFICPFLWLIGGWHFTNFGEQPPRLTFWEFYFNTGYWKAMCCGGRDKKREMDQEKREGKKVEPPAARLPRWVTEKQGSDYGRTRLNDPKRSLKGISFGYPFIPRPPPLNKEKTFWPRVSDTILGILGKPNRIFDQLYGVKLREVRGRPESGRRFFDPWIQRCRYALCYAMFFLAIGLCIASAYLIVYNTRALR
ncbi:hypothetical protein FA15DRAFT_582070 [Coprinopsis marcescibilis]|uniref:Uncharacterized protein n=1 Tax=Coprinopsis marcescibilis TaxID=230819 RepID=A0A5C3LLJ8_COPMA|nr:hypothetical protein FA15DRAFT_582070 [Coprinopsis marcescibilis]